MSKIRFAPRIDLALVIPILAGICLILTLLVTGRNLVTLFKPVSLPSTAVSPQQQVFSQALELISSLNGSKD